MHGKITEPVMKYMTGKHIERSLKTYIQNNKETFKAFKTIEPLISLSKTNGNGNLSKQLEEIKKSTAKQLAMLKLMEKLVSKEEMSKAIEDLAKDLDVKLEPKTDIAFSGIPEYDLETAITKIGEAILKKDLERILAENGNNNHS
jgi:hypothetical protein